MRTSHVVVGLLLTVAVSGAAVGQQADTVHEGAQARAPRDGLAAPVSAQAPDERTPADVPSARVDSLFSDLDRVDSPGCAVGVYSAGEVLFAKGYGMASLEHGVPLSPRSVLNIASVAKQFTALAVVLLARRGELSLDDPVRDHVPELPAYAAPVTVRHLIHHTSGLRNNVALLRLVRGQVEEDSEEVTLSLLAWQDGLNFEPGEHWMYSNPGYTLLARIVERVSGQSFREFTDREIFDPLGMTSTGFLGPLTTGGRALAYEPHGTNGYGVRVPTHTLLGTGGLYTTVEDLAKWDRNFYEKDVGGREGIALMHAPGRLNSGRETAYAFGFRPGRYRGLRTVGHSGGDPGYAAMLLRFPDERLSVAVLCNATFPTPSIRAYRVADLYLADRFPDDPPASLRVGTGDVRVSEAELEALAGVYRSRDGLRVQRFAVEDGALVVTYEGGRYPLAPLGERRFGDGLTRFVVTFGEPGAGDAMTATWRPNPSPRSPGPLRLHRVAPHRSPAAEELADYVGTFHSEELDASWKIVARDGELLLRRWGVADQRLESLQPDTFAFRGRTAPRLRFERDAAGRVAKLTVSTGEIVGVEFVRWEPGQQARMADGGPGTSPPTGAPPVGDSAFGCRIRTWRSWVRTPPSSPSDCGRSWWTGAAARRICAER